MLLPFDCPEEDLNWIREVAHTNQGGGGLISFCKKWDLRKPAYSPIVREIASWVDSPDDCFRHGVNFALCIFRPVPGYEWVAIEGWKLAPVLDLHWYGAAIRACLSRPELLDLEALDAVAARLDRPAPTPETFDREYYGDTFVAAVADHAEELVEAARVIDHFCKLADVDKPPSLQPVDERDLESLRRFADSWQEVVRRLRHVLAARGR